MTLHCPRCEVGWTTPAWHDRCWSCGQPGTIGFAPNLCNPTSTQVGITLAFGRTIVRSVV